MFTYLYTWIHLTHLSICDYITSLTHDPSQELNKSNSIITCLQNIKVMSKCVNERMVLNILEVKIDIWIDEEDACCCGVYTLQKCRCNVSRQRESFKRKGDGQRERSTNPSPATAAPLYTL